MIRFSFFKIFINKIKKMSKYIIAKAKFDRKISKLGINYSQYGKSMISFSTLIDLAKNGTFIREQSVERRGIHWTLYRERFLTPKGFVVADFTRYSDYGDSFRIDVTEFVQKLYKAIADDVAKNYINQ